MSSVQHLLSSASSATAVSGLPRSSVFLMVNSLETGGSERQFTALANALNRNLFQVRLGCLRKIGGFLPLVGEIREFDRGRNFFTIQTQRARLTLARHLRSHKVTVAHSFDFYANVMLIPAARLAGVPVIIGSHRQLGDLLSPMKRLVQSMLFRLCDRIICNSHAAARSLFGQGIPKSKVAVIHNGLPDKAFAEVAPAFPRAPGKLRIGMIARMNDPCKNHVVFLRAASRLAAEFPSIEFLLVGDGSLRTSLEDISRQLGLAERTRFLGVRDDIPAIMASMDISVLPSTSESLPNAVLESMAASLPVVATEVGGIPELVREGETGFLIPPNDEDRLANALRALVMHPRLRTQFGKRARSLARDTFSMDAIAQQYEQLYATTIKEKLSR